MPRYVAFLRAINVGGHTVTMSRLVELFEALELEEITTFIASGNVLFSSRAKPAMLERQIDKHLHAELGYPAEARMTQTLQPSSNDIISPRSSPFAPARQKPARSPCTSGMTAWHSGSASMTAPWKGPPWEPPSGSQAWVGPSRSTM